MLLLTFTAFTREQYLHSEAGAFEAVLSELNEFCFLTAPVGHSFVSPIGCTSVTKNGWKDPRGQNA